MPASVPSHLVHGNDIDLTVGPNAELSKCYYDGALEIKAGHSKKTEMLDYRAVTDAMVHATPNYSLSVPVIFKRENSALANAHPGTGFSRSFIACAGDRGGHAFPMDTAAPGYFIMGDITSTVEVGMHRKAKLELTLFGFGVTSGISGAA